MSEEKYKTKVFDRAEEEELRAEKDAPAEETAPPGDAAADHAEAEPPAAGSAGSGKPVRRIRRWQKIVIGVLAVLLLVLGGGYFFTMNKLDKIKKDNDLDLSSLTTVQVPGYRNIVLLGIDTRDMSVIEGTRSDTIMIASINETNKAVKVTSIYRDTLMKMGDWDNYEKATHAHAYGGAEMTLQTINQAMDIDATEYILFNFKAVADAVNAVGGLEIDVLEYEVDELNRITKHTAGVLGVSDYALCDGPGMQTLDGVQAVAYGRIRKGVGDDYKRTQRARDVMELLLKKVRGMSVADLNKILDIVLPQIRTNLTNTQILDLMADINKYEVVDSFGFPFQKYAMYIDDVSVVVPLDWEADVTRWHEKTFGETEYQISPQAKEISDHIKQELLDEGRPEEDSYDEEYGY
ncbi:MAG: LCP family protein [Clostridiales bacterium]|nr:LCP family protein [Clostridiales bacterium]